MVIKNGYKARRIKSSLYLLGLIFLVLTYNLAREGQSIKSSRLYVVFPIVNSLSTQPHSSNKRLISSRVQICLLRFCLIVNWDIGLYCFIILYVTIPPHISFSISFSLCCVGSFLVFILKQNSLRYSCVYLLCVTLLL